MPPPDTAHLSPPSLTVANERTSGSRAPSVLSVMAVNTSSIPQSKKSAKSTSSKHCRNALDDGEEVCTGTGSCSSLISTDSPTPLPSKSTNAASMITLAGAVASLGTSINHQTMSSDTHIATKVQGFINAKEYLNDLEKSLVGEYYALQPTLASGLLLMTPGVAEITLHRHAKTLTKDVEPELEDEIDEMSVCD